MLHLLHVSKKAVSLQRVFHSIRFKVNKRLGYGGIPFLCPYVSRFKRKAVS